MFNIMHKWLSISTLYTSGLKVKHSLFYTSGNKQVVESLKLSRLYTSGSKYQNYTQVVINVKIIYKWLKRLKMVKTV